MTLNKKEKNPRIAHWALELQNYDYSTEYKSGIQHVDALSRANSILVVEVNQLQEFELSICQMQDSVISEWTGHNLYNRVLVPALGKLYNGKE